MIVAIITFWVRRNLLKLSRFQKPELKGSAKKDANIILYAETTIMLLFLLMNAADAQLQALNAPHYLQTGYFPISKILIPLIENFSVGTLIIIERTCWWLHIIGILCFLNYLYYSKHLHILLAFPNTYFASLRPMGAFKVNEAITNY